MPSRWLFDWQRYDRQYRIAPNRDDLLWALARADFRNANWPDARETHQTCNPYAAPPQELSEEELDAMFDDDDGWLDNLGLTES